MYFFFPSLCILVILNFSSSLNSALHYFASSVLNSTFHFSFIYCLFLFLLILIFHFKNISTSSSNFLKFLLSVYSFVRFSFPLTLVFPLPHCFSVIFFLDSIVCLYFPFSFDVITFISFFFRFVMLLFVHFFSPRDSLFFPLIDFFLF